MFKILEHQVSFLILDRPTFSDHMLIISKKKSFLKRWNYLLCYNANFEYWQHMKFYEEK